MSSTLLRVLDALLIEACHAILLALAYQVFREVVFVVLPVVAGGYGLHRLARKYWA